MSIFTPDMIQEKLGADQIFHAGIRYNQKDLYAGVDKIIIASTVTVNTARVQTGSATTICSLS